MSAFFSVIVGSVVLLWIFTHLKVFRDQIRQVSVDRVMPDCFRGSRYGSCAYFKEFYDPSNHKTPVPFSTDIKGNEVQRIFTIDRDDYNTTQWDVKWQGKTLKTKGKLFTDESEVAAFKKLPSSDSSRIAETINGDLPPLSQKHEPKHSITEEDFSMYKDGETN